MQQIRKEKCGFFLQQRTYGFTLVSQRRTHQSMDWNNPAERTHFVRQTAIIAVRAFWQHDFLVKQAIESAERTQSPLEAIFATSFSVAPTKLLPGVTRDSI